LRKQRALTELAHVLRLYLAVVSGTAADRLMLASVLGQLGKTDEARSILDALGLEAPADAAVATARIQRALQDGHGDAAQAIAMQFRQWEHVPVRAAHLGMLALVRGGHPQAALDLFAACPDDPDGVLTSVAINAHRDLRQMDEADRLARRAIKQGRGTAALHYQLGISAHEAGNHDRAVVHFTQGLECAPDDLRILAAIGEVLLVLGRPAAALIHLTRALKLAPDLVHMRVLQARGFKAIRDYDGAAREWRDIVARQPEVPQWRREAASVLNLAGRHGEARALFGDLLRTRTAALPPSFEDGLEDLWGRADQVELPSARLEWAWRLRDPAMAIPREEWTRRAQWGYLADRLIYDWLECSPERAEQAMHRLADLDTSADLLTSDASQSGGLIIVTAHIGPMFAGPLALQLLDFESVWLASSPSMPGMSYTDSLISTSDQTDAQVVRRAIHALEAGKAVGLAVDGAMSLAAPRITFEGQEITYSSFAARLGHRRRARSFFTAPLWQDGRLTFHLAPLPFPDGDEDIDTYADRWRDAYLGQLRQMLAGEPENLRLSGGIWRHVRMPS
jgi:tetratricopeptide (TPR) repeat protein